MEAFDAIWNRILFNVSTDNPISVGDIVLVLLLLVFSFLLTQFLKFMIKRQLEKSNLRPDAVIAIRRVLFYIVVALITLTVLAILGIPITVFAFATGAIAIGVGFGAQNIINNFISGWILMAERPIRVDDFIEIEGAFGVVNQVGTRSTRIRRSDGVHMLVPNSKLLENTVVNWTLVDQVIRTTIRVGVAYGSSPKLVSELLEQVVSSHSSVLPSPEPELIFEDFGDNALIFDCFFWCDVKGEKSLRSIRSELRYAIHALFEEHEIVIAYPQRDIHLHTENPISVALENADRPKN